MSNYYQSISKLIISFVSKHLHRDLDRIILSYIIYESVNFHDWIDGNIDKNSKSISNKPAYILSEGKVKIWRIRSNYDSKQYSFNSGDRYLDECRCNIDLSEIDQLFDVWEISDASVPSFCFLVGYPLNLFGLMRVENNKIVEVIAAERIEQIYTHFAALECCWSINNSKIKIIDTHDYGFSSVKFIFPRANSNSLPYRLKYEFGHLINRLYYFIRDGYGNSKSVSGYIVSLNNGLWLSSSSENFYNVVVHSNLLSAINRSCGMYYFLEWQKSFTVERAYDYMKV